MELRVIDVRDPLYPDEIELRYRVLREPLGLSRADVAFPCEQQSLHLVAVDEKTVVGCVLFHANTPLAGRLFQMAVTPARQGHGLGRTLVRALEAELRRRGVQEVHLHARDPVVPFYERLGYAAFGEPFVQVSVLHRLMRRTL